MTMGISKGCLAWAGVVALIGTLQARADTPASASELEEITVTAQKRAESEQTVPLSMTTFSAVALQEKAVVDFFDYGTKVPNLGFAYTGDGMSTARTISIRGVSGDNVTGFYVDETPLPDSLDPRILDIDHIEVLRGPQGTLYGARSMGGTVRVITKTPDFTDSEVTVHAGMSDTARTDQPNYTGDIVANFPLVSDRAALRLSAFMDDEAGYFKRRYCTDPATAGVTCFPQTTGPLTTTVDNVGEVKNYGAAIGLSIKLTDDMMLTPRLLQQKSTYNGFLMSDVLTAPGQIGYPYPAGPYTLPSLVPTNFTQGRFFNIPEGGFDNWQLNSIDFKWNTGVGEFVSSSSYFSRKVIETEDETDFIWTALLPAVAANPAYPNIPGYPPGRISPTTGLPLPIPSAISEEKDYQRFVEEVRFASQLSGPVQFVTGLFYSDLHGAIPFAANYFPALAPGYGAQLTAANTCGIVGLCPNPANPDEIYGSHYKTDIEEPAVYGQVSYQFWEAWKATAGVRWNQVKTTAGGYQEGTVTQAPGGPSQVVDPVVTTKENSTTPKLELDYRITPADMVYASAAKGFRPGGLVPSVPAALCASQLPPGATAEETRAYQSDSLWSYELGTKTGWFENRLTVDAAIFYIDWKNIQQNILLPCGFQYKANAGAAFSKGGEIEVRALPIDPLELTLGVGNQNARITQPGGALSPLQEGEHVFEVPDWTGNTSGTWTARLSDEYKLVSEIDYSYVGHSFSANNLVENAGGVFETRLRPHYDLLDARIALAHGKVEYAFVGKNLGNTAANLADNRSLAAETPGRPRLVTNQPRTIGLEVRASF
jgi:outer membrane receptor protein involved in Fe transport